MKPIRPINWNKKTDEFTQKFWKQFLKQFWVDDEIGIGKDLKHWKLMPEPEKLVFKRVLAGLTMLDTLQSEVGMPSLKDLVEDQQRKATLGFMETMESIHAKSYSNIFSTLISSYETDEIMAWAEEERHLQYKGQKIQELYKNAKNSHFDCYMGFVGSVFLESFLFYSGFYYPLYLAGHGRMMASADMINLIIRDESLHGVYVGLLAQELYSKMTVEEQQLADKLTYDLLEDLMQNEIKYTYEVYGEINMIAEVTEFLKYNANKALMNLGKAPKYQGVAINSIVEAGLSTDTKNHDFFSVKGNGYIKAQIEPLQDEDFAEWR